MPPAFENPAIGTKSIYKEILLQVGNKESCSTVKTKHKEPKFEDQAKTVEEKSPSKHLKEFRSLLSAVFHDKKDSNSAVFYEKENLNPQQTSCNLVTELEEAANSYSTAKARLAAKAKRSPPSPKRQIANSESEKEELLKLSPKKKLKPSLSKVKLAAKEKQSLPSPKRQITNSEDEKEELLKISPKKKLKLSLSKVKL